MAHELPPPARMLHIIMGPWMAQAAGAVARLGVADQLAAGPRSAAELAALVGANADALHRVMRALASIGVFALAGDRFTLTPLGETLRSNVPGSMRNMVIAETDHPHWASWGRFAESVKSGRRTSRDALGMEVWEYYGKHRDDGAQFSRAMSDISSMAIGPVLHGFDFAGAAQIVDVGGAHGALLAAVLAEHPQARGVLFDLPEVVAAAQPSLAARGLGERVTTVGGDFLKAVPAGGDVYLLKHILHDWDDARAVAILGNIRAAMKPTSRLLIVELALPESAEPSPAHFMDLNMLVMLDGRERTPSEYAALLAQAGLRLTRFSPTASPVGLAEAVPA